MVCLDVHRYAPGTTDQPQRLRDRGPLFAYPGNSESSTALAAYLPRQFCRASGMC